MGRRCREGTIHPKHYSTVAFSFSKISMSVPQRMVIALRYVSTPMEAISACVIPATSWSRMGRLALVSLDVE